MPLARFATVRILGTPLLDETADHPALSNEDQRTAFSGAAAAAVDVAVREVRVHLPES